MISFCVDGNPIPKARARVTARGTYTPATTRAYESLIRHHAVAAGAKRNRFAGPVAIKLWFYRDSAQVCDLDNLAKAVTDALNTVAYADDSQIYQMVATKAIDRERPRVEVEIVEMSPALETKP